MKDQPTSSPTSPPTSALLSAAIVTAFLFTLTIIRPDMSRIENPDPWNLAAVSR